MLVVSKRDGVWRLTAVGGDRARVGRKDRLVRLASYLAARCGSSIYVYDDAGQLEKMQAFPPPNSGSNTNSSPHRGPEAKSRHVAGPK